MMMTAGLRKFALTAHVTSSVGWLGAAAAYLALAITALTSRDPQMVRAAYLSMEVMGWLVIVPCSFAALLSGLVQSLGTDWGLFRHYWIAMKLVLTIGATTVLLLHMPTVSRMAGVAAETTSSNVELGALPLVVHAAGGLLVLLATTTLSIYKPWGMTAYGRRRQREGSQLSPLRTSTISTRGWLYLSCIIAIVLFLLFIGMHFTGAGFGVQTHH
jgi:hypothetical protein